jgi:protein SCO1/2
LKFTFTRDGYQMHGLVTHLIDKSGNLRGRYHGLKFSATNMVLHINTLTNDFH